MSLLAFLVACGVGAVVALLARPSVWVVRVAGLGGLLVAFVAALFIGPATTVTIGDVALTGSEYSGLFLACVAGAGLLLCVVALAVGWSDELAPGALGAFAGLAVAITATDAGVSLVAAAAAATAGTLVIARTDVRTVEEDGRLAEIRTIGLVVAATLFAAVAVLRPAWTGPSDSPVLVVAFIGLALALAVRSGAVPFHVPVARFPRSAAPLAPALLAVWLPAGLGLIAIGWSATTFAVRDDWLNLGVAGLQVVALATLVLGALAALVHDEIEEIVAYSIVADAAFVLLALASRTDAAAEPARLWLLVFVAAKTGLVAWAAAVSRAFGTSNLRRLRGWLRRAPLLGLALVMIAIATLGWPGGAVYEARLTLIRVALPDQLQLLFAVSILLSIACYGRLLVTGLLSPTPDVSGARSELPRWASAAAQPVPIEGEPVAATTAEQVPKREPVPNADAVPAVVAATEPTAGGGSATDSEPSAAPVPDSATPDGKLGPGVRRQLTFVWRLNRTLEVSLVVLSGAALAVALAFGGLGATEASQSGIPIDAAARATPTPSPKPTPTSGTTATPLPTLAPRPTIGPSGLEGPSGSIPPSGSPGPINTSGPARGAGN